MIDLEKFDPNRRRELDVRGEKFIFQCTDPHGYWYVHRPRGQMPASLAESAYTELSYAVRAVEAYLAAQPQGKTKDKAV